METSSTVIADTLARMDDVELVQRWRNGMFSDDAKPIAAAELRSRQIDPDRYSLPDDVPIGAGYLDDSDTDEPAKSAKNSNRPIYINLVLAAFVFVARLFVAKSSIFSWAEALGAVIGAYLWGLLFYIVIRAFSRSVKAYTRMQKRDLYLAIVNLLQVIAFLGEAFVPR